MTFVAHISKFTRRYILSPESIICFVLIIIIYNTFHHVKPLWNYWQRAKFHLQRRSREEETNSDIDNITWKDRSSWEMMKGNAAMFAIQGRRPHMEDRFNMVNDLEGTRTSLYGIFDGHGGEFAAEFVEKTIFKELMVRLLRPSTEDNISDNLTQILAEEVLSVDSRLLDIERNSFDISGTTALIAIVRDRMLTVANVGDSRGVICDKNGKTIPLSFDHKPQQVKERRRIKEAGGFVSFNGVWRVAGVLATSRALGDYPLKEKNLVIADPDILTFDLNELQPEFMILASDGLWDCFSNEDAVDYVRERLDEPHFGAKSLVLQAYYRGSLDNITVMVVNFKQSYLGIAKKEDR
ncbi:hypothetical protein CHS0354_034940 [Potamilus streckersoni]|uniref:Protein phosphatase 1L n=1 Tax=Potamilus streckersoni TaxID=2493646 RepID=A0AAE0SDY1_9BIVA|nr:hypothetical protein CHS0354_034940 [Potamilus streckersoni]